MSKFLQEVQGLIDQGGAVLWVMRVLSVVLYTIMATSWVGIFRVKGELVQLQQELNELPTQELVRDRIDLFELVRIACAQRLLPVLSVLIALAPLSGLLGTVSGILSTFAGMASRHTIKPIDSISSGISEALITTQTGLLIAIPAALLFALLKSQFDSLSGQLQQSLAQSLRPIS